MHLDGSAVERPHLDFEADQLLLLESLEDPRQHAILGPGPHAGVNRVPVPQRGWQLAPLRAILGNVKDRIENLQMGLSERASGLGKTVLYLLVLGLGQFHFMPIKPPSHACELYLNML